MAGNDRTWWDRFELPQENQKKQSHVYRFDLINR